jgi:hypothetical protein
MLDLVPLAGAGQQVVDSDIDAKPNFHTCYAALSGNPQNTAPFASIGKIVVLNMENLRREIWLKALT